MASNPKTSFLVRLDVVEQRLHEHAANEAYEGVTDPHPVTGEQWDVGQLWAHLAEVLPYWIGQVRMVVAAPPGEPVPFGRVATDAERLAAIDDGRHEPVGEQMGRVGAEIAALRDLLVTLPDEAWARRGIHEIRGEMTVEEIVDDFMIAHLETHAAQLDALAART